MLHLPVQHAVTHDIALGVTVDAVHATLVVHIRRADGRIVQIEDPVQLGIGRARDLGSTGRIRWQLRQSSKVEADRCIAVVTRSACCRRRRARHRVGSRVPRLVLRYMWIVGLGKALCSIGNVAGRAPIAAVVTVESDAASNRSPLGPEVTLHALLARQVREVSRKPIGSHSALELRHLHDLVQAATLFGSARNRKDPVLRAALLEQPHLVEAVRQVARGGAMQAGE